jgi:PAS domain S-box-containing protein
LAKLKQSRQTKYIPVIFLTTLNDTDTRIKGVELGDDLITKPFEAREVLARVERQVTVSKVRMALRESETKFRSVMESAIDAIISADASGTILSWNSAATALFGFTADEAISRPLELIIPERYRKLHQQGIRRVSSGGPSRVIGKTVEVAAVRKNGSEFPVELSLATWFLEKERYYTGIIRDISERKQAEQKFRSVTESAVDAIISADHTGNIVSWNNAATRILGYTAEEAIGQRLEIIIPERFHEAHRKGMQRVTAGGESRVIGKTVELFARTKTGAEVPIELSLATWNVREEIYYTGIIRDIRERKQAEEALRKSEEKYRRIVETAGEGFILMDKNLIITDVNEALCQLVGLRRENIIGKTPLEFATEDFRQFLETNQKEISAGKYKEFEGTVVSQNDRNIPVLVHGSTLRDDQGRVIGNMAFVTNLSEQKKSLALAAEVQKSLQPPTALQVSGLDVAGRTIACEEIGGDYFDFLQEQQCAGDHFDAVVGDVTGHGVDAALFMTTARAFLRMSASQCGDISQIITEMNRHLTLDILETGRFMTLFYMRIYPENKTLQWVRAGHDPAIIYDPGEDKFEELNGAGLALGVDGNYVYEENLKTGLVQGQIIAIGTDGIWETFNTNGKMFGKKQFRDIVRENSHLEANEIIDAVYSELSTFSKGLKKEDDATLVIIKLEEISKKVEDWRI